MSEIVLHWDKQRPMSLRVQKSHDHIMVLWQSNTGLQCPAPHVLFFTIVYIIWKPFHLMIRKTHWTALLRGELPISAGRWILITTLWFYRTSGGLSQFVHCKPHCVRRLVFNSSHWILIIHTNTYDSFVLLVCFFFCFRVSMSSKNLSRVRFRLQLSSNVIHWDFSSIISALNLIYIYEAFLGTHADILVTVAPGVLHVVHNTQHTHTDSGIVALGNFFFLHL